MLAKHLVVLIALVAACSGNGGSGGDLSGEPTPCAAAGSFTPSPGDRDGDGLPDDLEIAGWEIQVDAYGLGTEAGLLTVYTVASSPDCADTDNDGLPDGEEYDHRTDPTDADTDGDGLSDPEELRRWKTSPLSVDSDGDATGPDGLEVPNSFLFDGAEIVILGTSPSLDDTDGDSVSDFDEYDDPVRNPLVAEIPSASFQFQGEVDIRLRVTYSETEGQETEYGETFSTTESTTSKKTTLDGAVVESEASTSLLKDAAGIFANFLPGKDDKKSTGPEAKSAVIATIAACAAIAIGTSLVYCATAGKRDADGPIHFKQDDPDATRGKVAEWAAGANDTVSGFLCAPKTTDSSSTTLVEESVKSAQKSYSNYRRDSRSRTETTASGSVKVGATIRNTGLTTVSVEDLFVTMLQWQPSPDPQAALGAGAFRTLATLKPAVEALVLSPGETSPVVELSAIDVDPNIIKQFLARPGGIVYGPAGISLHNAEGIDFKFLTEKTFARTAVVTIDFGGGRSERYQVATNVARDEDGDLAGITMAEIMAILGIPFETFEVEREIDGEVVKVQALKSIRDVSAEVVGETGDPENGVPRNPFGFWLVGASREEQTDPAVDFQAIVVHHADEINLVYMEDRDGDGLFAREEAILGTSDSGDDEIDNATGEATPDGLLDGFDTDRDGLSDFVEARGGWTVEITYDVIERVSYRCCPNPRAADADEDGWDDAEERAAGTDPNNADTDDDNLPDPTDPDPLQPALRLYVNQAAPAGGDGQSWATAYRELRDALLHAQAASVDVLPGTSDLDHSNDISEIWVAEGVYKPHATDKNASFVLVDGVSVLGGFVGFERTVDQRNPDPLTNYCVLSGDLLGNDASSLGISDPERQDNSLHVVRAPSSVRSGALDGFHVIAGNALNTLGGGLRNTGGKLEIRNTHFLFNLAKRGGAVYDESGGGQLVFRSCRFESNRATQTEATGLDAVGGGLFLRRADLFDCEIVGNLAGRSGGGMFLAGEGVGALEAKVTAEDCLFARNRAESTRVVVPFVVTPSRPDGGAIYADRAFDSLVLERCIFDENYAGPGPSGQNGGFGGAIYLYNGISSSPRLRNGDVRITNCRFSNNEARSWSEANVLQYRPGGFGAAIATENSFDTALPWVRFAMTNCTVANNAHTGLAPGSGAVYLQGCEEVYVANSVFWGNTSTTGDTELRQISLGTKDRSGNPLNRRVTNCCVQGLGANPPGLDTATNIGADPQFVDTAATDFRLKAGSPCIDRGLNIVDVDPGTAGLQKLPATDLDGRPRVVDGDGNGTTVVDIGAYEK